MKKIAIIILAVIAVVAVGAVIIFGTKSEAKITGVTYVSGMPEEVSINQTPDYSALKIKVAYDNNTEKEVAYNAKDFTVEFDNKTAANSVKVKITYNGFTCETTINVVDKNNQGDEAKLTGITYLSGMPEEVALNQTPDYSALKIKASYDDNTEKEIAYNAKDFTVEFDNKTVANNVKVKITYNGFTCETTINVINKFELDMVELPEFAKIYNSVGTSQFKDKTAPYYVGNYNEFFFVPVVTAFDLNDDMYKFSESGELEFAAEVLLVNGDATSSIDTPADYYTYDGERSAFKFTAAADGKTFRISAHPVDLNETQMANVKKYTVTFDVTVKDGYYNVYNAVDLLVMENRAEMGSTEREAQPMKDFKVAHGITFNSNEVKGLAVQANIELGKEDFPEEYFWTAADVGGNTQLIGSLKDYIYMIRRELGADGQFAIEGNYFTLNVEKMPKVLAEGRNTPTIKNPNEIVSHSKFFYVLGESQHNGTTNTESFAINNLNALGNINRTDGDTTGEGENFQSGGLIFMEENGAKVDLNNCIAKCWYITAFSSTTSDEHFLTVNKCIFVDDYNCIFYLWGGILELKETDAYGAGGPVFIADHCRYDSTDGRDGTAGGWTSDIRVDESSTVYSYVTGQEGWFKQMGATGMAAQITAMDAIFNSVGYTFRKTIDGKQVMNIVAIYKAGGVESATGLFENATSGKGTFGKNQFSMNGGVLDVFMNTSIGEGLTIGNSGMPIFYGSTQTSVIAYNPTDEGKASSILAAELGGAATSFVQVAGLSIFNDNGGYLNALIGDSGKPGKVGLVFGDYGKLA